MTSVETALRGATRRLQRAGVAGARRDARLLLCRALSVGMEQLIAYPDRRLAVNEVAGFNSLLARRAAREPLSRILGEREFWSLPLRITPATLDPRPDSETLVAALLERLLDRGAPLALLDLGSGSGCLLLALLSELPQARGLGIDVSAAAVETARDNAQRLGLRARATFRTGDWCEGLAGRFDLIVSNPPYVPSDEVGRLEPEVAGFDPRAALDGGEDGLDAYRHLAGDLHRLLRPGGWVGVEIGAGQAVAVSALLRAAGFARIEQAADLSGRVRVLLASRGDA